ncbi:kinase-like domain-containing protein [Hyaloraphidium curvatum]|nr:kinase-like domain-containing protein [Hyaloraphidium curvatum]
MYDQYMNLYTFLGDRKKRTARFKEQMHGMGFAEMSVEYKARWNRFLEKEGAAMRERRTRTKAVDFVILSQIGQGGYGSVFLAKKKATEEVVALKKMSKTLLHRLGEVDHILTERDILTQSRSPWLVKLLYSFQDTENVYLAMEYVPGGDIRTLLNVNPGPIAESHCRFYLAEMALGVNALHEMGYIHRDLKPENFLIDTRGHVKLTDFGLAKGRISYSRIESMKLRLGRAQADVVARSFKENQVLRNENRRREVRATSLVGSPDYMAPEILNTPAGGYDKLVDYWSLGTILFEFLVGYPPFQGANADEVWNNVLQWTKILVRPTEVLISDNAWSMITALIAHKPNRLSSINALQCHPFMKPLAFGLLGTSAGPRPPFVPDLADAFDTRHFDDFTDPASMAIYAEVHEKRAETEQQASKAGKGAGEEEARGIRRGFVGFTFRRNDGEKLAREAGLRRQGSTSRDLLFDA